jgi:RND family efflux transporter MFP subunit
MRRTRWVFTSAIALMLMMVSVYLPTFAHDDHAPPPTDGFDPFAPRTVTPETAKMIGLEVAEVDFGIIETVERLTGMVRIEPERKHTVSPRVAGTVARVHVQVGDRVQKGDVLIEVDSPEFARLQYERARLESERVEFDVARRAALGSMRQHELTQYASEEMLVLAREELARLERSGEAISINQIGQKRSAVLMLERESETSRLMQELAQEEAVGLTERIEAMQAASQALSRLIQRMTGTNDLDAGRGDALRLRAASDGIVTNRHVSVGQDVQQGDRLIELAALDRVQIIAELPESLLDRVRDAQGKITRIRQPREGSVRATGVVRTISPLIDPIKRTAHIIIDAENADGLLNDGMFVEAALVLDEGDYVVVVPHSAILIDGPERYVFIREGEQFKRQEVALGARDDHFVEVTDGLVPGDEVIVRGAYAVSQIRPRVAVDHHDHDHGHGHRH